MGIYYPEVMFDPLNSSLEPHVVPSEDIILIHKYLYAIAIRRAPHAKPVCNVAIIVVIIICIPAIIIIIAS